MRAKERVTVYYKELVTGKFAPTNNQELLIIINSEYCIGYKTRERD